MDSENVAVSECNIFSYKKGTIITMPQLYEYMLQHWCDCYVKWMKPSMEGHILVESSRMGILYESPRMNNAMKIQNRGVVVERIHTDSQWIQDFFKNRRWWSWFYNPGIMVQIIELCTFYGWITRCLKFYLNISAKIVFGVKNFTDTYKYGVQFL